jgi:TetR/AcrR family transcriptional repressor of mexJK operon
MEQKNAERPKRGRPRDPERMRRVLDIAQQHFVTQGFERTSLDSIAKDSGVSKMTIYSYFPSKEALFEATVAGRTDTVFNVARTAALNPVHPKTALTRVGGEFLTLMRDDAVIGVHRMLYGSAAHQPTAGTGFYQQGPHRLITELALYLRAAHQAGTLVVHKPDLAADQFLSLFLGGGHIRALLGLGKPSSQSDAELLRENVALFLSRYAPHDGGKSIKK